MITPGYYSKEQKKMGHSYNDLRNQTIDQKSLLTNTQILEDVTRLSANDFRKKDVT
jgi:hypothetical protein